MQFLFYIDLLSCKFLPYSFIVLVVNNVFCAKLCWVEQAHAGNETSSPTDRLYIMFTIDAVSCKVKAVDIFSSDPEGISLQQALKKQG